MEYFACTLWYITVLRRLRARGPWWFGSAEPGGVVARGVALAFSLFTVLSVFFEFTLVPVRRRLDGQGSTSAALWPHTFTSTGVDGHGCGYEYFFDFFFLVRGLRKHGPAMSDTFVSKASLERWRGRG